MGYQQTSPDVVTDVYFSADVETDGPIPGPYSMLSFAIVVAGHFDGVTFARGDDRGRHFYAELRPISDDFEQEALNVNGLDRAKLSLYGEDPALVMTRASDWIKQQAGLGKPVLVAYPLSFDWMWLYWYFVRFGAHGSPFNHSRCFDLKTAYAVKARVPISRAGRDQVRPDLRSAHIHTHNALDDAVEQADIFANIFEWEGPRG
jgi:hypothetical protein